MSALLRDDQAGRHHPRHEPRARRPPDARPSAQLLAASSTTSCPTACARKTSGSTTTSSTRLAAEHKPKLIIVGASAYPRVIDFARIAAIAQRSRRDGDDRHGAHRRPGRRRACIRARCRTPISSRRPRTRRCAARAAAWCCAAPQNAKELDKSVFPGVQGGPLMHIIAAKAVCFKEAARTGVRATISGRSSPTRSGSRRRSPRRASRSSAAAPTIT